jgi:hypothetical protein
MTILPNGESWAFNWELEKLQTVDTNDYRLRVPTKLLKLTPREFVEEYFRRATNESKMRQWGDYVSVWTDRFGGYWEANDKLLETVAIHTHTTKWGTTVTEMTWGDVYVENQGCGECETTITHFKNINHYLAEAFKIV